MEYENNNYDNTTRVDDGANTTGRNILIGVIAIVVLVGLGYIFRPSSGTVAGVQTNTPSVPSQTTGSLQGTVQAPGY